MSCHPLVQPLLLSLVQLCTRGREQTNDDCCYCCALYLFLLLLLRATRYKQYEYYVRRAKQNNGFVLRWAIKNRYIKYSKLVHVILFSELNIFSFARSSARPSCQALQKKCTAVRDRSFSQSRVLQRLAWYDRGEHFFFRLLRQILNIYG